jgi:hypothetical protein
MTSIDKCRDTGNRTGVNRGWEEEKEGVTVLGEMVVMGAQLW